MNGSKTLSCYNEIDSSIDEDKDDCLGTCYSNLFATV
jgi:hypothetical protein